jgi:hypothetical protein
MTTSGVQRKVGTDLAEGRREEMCDDAQAILRPVGFSATTLERLVPA